MSWVTFVAGAVLSWGIYGAALHKGQVALGNPLRAVLCVGIAYFLLMQTNVSIYRAQRFDRADAEAQRRAGHPETETETEDP